MRLGPKWFVAGLVIAGIGASPIIAQQPRGLIGIEAGAVHHDFVGHGNGVGGAGAVHGLIALRGPVTIDLAFPVAYLPSTIIEGDISVSHRLLMMPEASLQFGQTVRQMRGYIGAGLGGSSHLAPGEIAVFRGTWNLNAGLEVRPAGSIVPGLQVRKRWLSNEVDNEANHVRDSTLDVSLTLRWSHPRQ